MPGSHKIKLTDEFTSAMQHLSAEAAKTLPRQADEQGGPTGNQLAEVIEEFRTLNGRVEQLEKSLTARLEKLAEPNPEPDGFKEQFAKMEEHMAAIRETESVNQRLFDSLHEELIKYRDNFLHESLQKPFIRDLVVLYDDLSTVSTQVASAAEGKGSQAAQWRDNIENTIHSLVEILHRLEVREIEPKDTVDRAYHRVVSFEPADFAEEDGRIVMRLKHGFLWRDQVLRPEEVVAKRFS